jgi:soluble lytic murein transglycosylase
LSDASSPPTINAKSLGQGVAQGLILACMVLLFASWSFTDWFGWVRAVPFIGPWLSNTLQGDNGTFQLFRGGEGLSIEEARELYQQGLAAQKAGQWPEAIEAFKKLEQVYPGLRSLLNLRLAELYAQLPREDLAQLRYKVLLEEDNKSPLCAFAAYSLGQSQLRANQKQEAQQTFNKVLRLSPKSKWATAANYYLGLLEAPNTNERNDYWRTYLKQAPEGRFAVEIAQTLSEELGDRVTATDKKLFGLALASQGRAWPQVIKWLKPLPQEAVWWPLSQAYLETNQPEQGLALIETYLGKAETPELAQLAVDKLLSSTSQAGQIAALKRLAGREPAMGGDYVLWLLAQKEPANANAYYEQLASAYPTSDYAPESSWAQLWSLLRQGKDEAFIKAATTHMNQHAYSASAPRVLFWLGRVMEQRKQESKAKAIFKQLLKHYPWDYYAYRAYGHLVQLEGMGKDPAWLMSSQDQGNLETPSVEVAALVQEAMPKTSGGDSKLAAHHIETLEELLKMGATEDLRRYSEEVLGVVPPLLEGWLQQQEGQTANGIKTITEAWKKSFRNNGQPPSPQTLVLLYPTPYKDVIHLQAQNNQLDPFLVQSLMREESRFNPLAVSGSYAMGLMQLLPSTAQDVAGWVGLSPFVPVDLFRPEVNIRLGSRYLGYLQQQFKGQAMPAVGAYNGGPGAMQGWLNATHGTWAKDPDWFVETIPYEESRNYIKKVFGSYWNYTQLYRPEQYPHLKEWRQG